MGWITALLLKAFAFMVFALLYYVVVYRPVKKLERIFPDGKIKRFLFRERGTYDTRPPAEGD